MTQHEKDCWGIFHAWSGYKAISLDKKRLIIRSSSNWSTKLKLFVLDVYGSSFVIAQLCNSAFIYHIYKLRYFIKFNNLLGRHLLLNDQKSFVRSSYRLVEIIFSNKFQQYLLGNLFFLFSAKATEVCTYLQFGYCFFNCFSNNKLDLDA
jgi:hypothetical protein